MLKIEVAYALPNTQRIIALEVMAGSTIEVAILQSGILMEFPEIDLTKQKVGVFSKMRQLTDLIQDGERIEIYRELIIDPKEARRVRGRFAKPKS